MSSYIALIPAAGRSQRFTAGTTTSRPKQYERLGDCTVLEHSLRTFQTHPAIRAIYLVVAADDETITQLTLPSKVTVLRVGGASRHASVSQGLVALRAHHHSDDWVLVHDAARPGLSHALITRLIAAVGDVEIGGLLALPVSDTLKHEIEGHSAATLPRAQVWQAQTPQMFRLQALQEALQHVPAHSVTDEASAMEMLGHAPKLVHGALRTMKITYPDDLDTVATLMGLK